MKDEEKQFEDFVSGMKFDDEPNPVHRDKLEVELLAAMRNQPRQVKAWRIVMKSPITKLAAAAVLVIAVFNSMHYFVGPIDGTSVAWGEVVKNIERISMFTCEAKINSKGMKSFGYQNQSTCMLYTSAEYGSRKDIYFGDEIILTLYFIPAKNKVVGILPTAKRCVYIPVPKELFDSVPIGLGPLPDNPREFLKDLMSFKYVELGDRTINGIMTEGIEVNDPKLCYGVFETFTARLWVDVKTNLPVVLEVEGSADNGKIWLNEIFDNFEWDVDINPDMFEPNIPADYTLVCEKGIDNKNEEMAIEGLRNFAEFAKGHYPTSLIQAIAGRELLLSWEASTNWKPREPGKKELEQFQTIISTCYFLAELDKEGKDVAYYGDKVTAEDANSVLMRWKVSDNEYRVILGDLTVENVTAEDLIDLENSPQFAAIMQRHPWRPKEPGIIGVELVSWPRLKVFPDSPAAKAGLQTGDVVIEVNHEIVSNVKNVNDAFKLFKGYAGEKLSITIERGGQILDFEIERVSILE